MKLSSSLLLLSLALSGGLSSCVDVGGGGYGSGYAGGGFNNYASLPHNFNGNAYHHNGRYYSGGNYQTGNYSHQGQTYTSRYSHNGQHYYGGSHQHYTPQQSSGYKPTSQQRNGYNSTPQRRSGYNSDVNVNTPVLQQHINSQFLQGRR